MTYSNEAYISPHWPGFRGLWLIVAIILFVLLFLIWIMGCGPGGRNCVVPVKTVEKIVQVEVTAPDKLAPLINLNESSVVRIVAGNAFSDAGATALDNIDGNITVTTTGTVDTTTPGEYILTYTATDQAGNTVTETRKVIVEAAKLAPVGLPDTAKLYFDHDSGEFPADIDLSLAPVIAWLNTHDTSTVVISGFHSSVGSFERNQKLSKERAEAVSKMLQDIGISADRIILEKPVETTGSGSEEEARRVEVKIGDS